MSIKNDIRKEFEGLTKKEVIQVLRDAGFNVKEGTGKIVIHATREEGRR